jgi:hypothetical protein
MSTWKEKSAEGRKFEPNLAHVQVVETVLIELANVFNILSICFQEHFFSNICLKQLGATMPRILFSFFGIGKSCS